MFGPNLKTLGFVFNMKDKSDKNRKQNIWNKDLFSKPKIKLINWLKSSLFIFKLA